MARKKANIHYLYKTTCLITGRWYIGMHSTCNMDDGYMGSGKRLRRSIRKYGVDNHKKEILGFFENRELLIEVEKKAITPDMVLDDNCMNLKGGGTGGFVNEEHRQKFLFVGLQNLKVNQDKRIENMKKTLSSDACRKKMSEALLKYFETNENNFKGKQHSDETKKIISEKAKLRTGENNSQYGTCWITKDGLNKKIKKEEIETYLNEGWIKGRK